MLNRIATTHSLIISAANSTIFVTMLNSLWAAFSLAVWDATEFLVMMVEDLLKHRFISISHPSRDREMKIIVSTVASATTFDYRNIIHFSSIRITSFFLSFLLFFVLWEIRQGGQKMPKRDLALSTKNKNINCLMSVVKKIGYDRLGCPLACVLSSMFCFAQDLKTIFWKQKNRTK